MTMTTMSKHFAAEGIEHNQVDDLLTIWSETNAMKVVAAVSAMMAGSTELKFEFVTGGQRDQGGAWATLRGQS